MRGIQPLIYRLGFGRHKCKLQPSTGLADVRGHVQRIAESYVRKRLFVATNSRSQSCQEPAQKLITHESRVEDGRARGSRSASTGSWAKSWGEGDVCEDRCIDSQRLKKSRATSVWWSSPKSGAGKWRSNCGTTGRIDRWKNGFGLGKDTGENIEMEVREEVRQDLGLL